jgi:hypothetical protein
MLDTFLQVSSPGWEGSPGRRWPFPAEEAEAISSQRQSIPVCQSTRSAYPSQVSRDRRRQRESAASGHQSPAMACCPLRVVGGRWRFRAASEVCERQCPSTFSRSPRGLGESPASGQWPAVGGRLSVASGQWPWPVARCQWSEADGGSGQPPKSVSGSAPQTYRRSRRGLAESSASGKWPMSSGNGRWPMAVRGSLHCPRWAVPFRAESESGRYRRVTAHGHVQYPMASGNGRSPSPVLMVNPQWPVATANGRGRSVADATVCEGQCLSGRTGSPSEHYLRSSPRRGADSGVRHPADFVNPEDFIKFR